MTWKRKDTGKLIYFTNLSYNFVFYKIKKSPSLLTATARIIRKLGLFQFRSGSGSHSRSDESSSGYESGSDSRSRSGSSSDSESYESGSESRSGSGSSSGSESYESSSGSNTKSSSSSRYIFWDF